MKILICSEYFYPHIGGVEKHSEKIVKYFYNKGHQVHLVTSYINKRKKFKHIKYHEFKISGNIVKGYNGETIKYQKFLLNNKFDVIFFNAAQQWTFDLSLSIIKEIKSKKILFPCGFSRLKNPAYYLYFKYINTKINYFDNIICSNKNASDYIYLKKHYKKKIFLINNGADYLKPIYNKKKLLKKFNIPDDYKIICNISNYKFYKGQDIAIDIFKKIKTNKSFLFLIGNNLSPIYFFFIKKIINKFNSQFKYKKIILHSTNYDEAMTILKHSDLFLFTSRLEYDPLVLYESIIYNKKFVSRNVGLANKLHKNLGYVSNNIFNLSKKVDQFLRIKKSKKITTNKYKWKNILKKYESVFFK